MHAWCDVFSNFVASGTLSVLVFSAVDYVFLCVQCVLLVEWLYQSTNNTHCTHKNT